MRAATLSKALSKSFGLLEAPTFLAASTKRLWRSASVILGLGVGGLVIFLLLGQSNRLSILGRKDKNAAKFDFRYSNGVFITLCNRIISRFYVPTICAAISCGKSEIVLYLFPWAGSNLRLAGRRRGEREGLQRLRRSAQNARQGGTFSYFFRRNPLKSPDLDE